MAWTDAEELRIEAIEELLNQVQIAISNLASKAQFTQFTLIRQAEIDALTTRVTALESQLALLQNQIG